MIETFELQAPLWETAARGAGIYLILAAIVRLLPKRQAGDVSPNDLLALVVVGAVTADAMVGEITGMVDLFVVAIVVLLIDYGINLLEYRFPRFRRVAQHTPTLLVHDGVVLRRNLQKEKVTDEELAASLRKAGVDDVARVKLAVLEADGHVTVIKKD